MEYKCLECNKDYSSYKSLWNHNKIKHIDCQSKVSINGKSEVSILNTYPCRFCNKSYLHKQSRFNHEKKCKDKHITDTIILKKENIQIKEEVKEQNKKIEQLETIVNKLSKTNSNNVTVNGNINTVNNINSLGYENIHNNISEKDKMYILTSIMHKEYPITELVRKIYTDELLKNERNTLLTNLRSKDCLIYKSETNKFEATNKNDHIDNIIETRRNDVVKIYNEFTENSKIKLKPRERQAIEDYLEKIEGIDKKDKNLKAFYEKHKEEIIYIIYNCKEFMGTIRDHLNNIVEDNDNTIEV
jgi:hypothetical protein